jgi:hypothetical protein
MVYTAASLNLLAAAINYTMDNSAMFVLCRRSAIDKGITGG